jgi:hypothetical protein
MSPSKIRCTALPLALASALLWGAPGYCTPIEDVKVLLAQKDFTQAAKLLLPLANEGDNEAQRLIGELCLSGQGFPKDANAAYQWTRVAAENENAIGQYNLGYLYEKGIGVARSSTEAQTWYGRSARQGFVLAQRRMGELLEYANPSESARWYEAAMLQGDELSRNKYNEVGGQVNRTSQRIARAESEAQERAENAERDAAYEKSQREWRRSKAEADAQNARVSTADMIMGQVRKNAAEASRIIGDVNRQPEYANAQIARAKEQQFAQNSRSSTATSTPDRTNSSGSSSRATPNSRSTSDSTSSTEGKGSRNSGVSSSAADSQPLLRQRASATVASPVDDLVETDPGKVANAYLAKHPSATDQNYAAELAAPKRRVREGSATSMHSSEREARAALQEMMDLLPKKFEIENSSHIRYVKFLGFAGTNCWAPPGQKQFMCNVQYDLEVAGKPGGTGSTVSK